MEGHIHHHQLHHQQYQHQYQQAQPMGGMVGVDTVDRFPQWSIQETKEFLGIRAELDQAFMETKRNKLLWEVISSKMREKGFIRSFDQCKCKWKNLVTRYKGCETIEEEAVRQQFPFYNEMQTIFTSRMERMLWAEAEAAESSRKAKAPPASSAEEEEEDEGDDDHDSEEEHPKGVRKKKIIKPNKKAKVVASGGGGIRAALKEVVEEVMKQQMEMEERWREAYEAREEERRRVEREWRQRMEALENERVAMERRWREREEQRRFREEARADHRDALITALLNKLSSSQPPSL